MVTWGTTAASLPARVVLEGTMLTRVDTEQVRDLVLINLKGKDAADPPDVFAEVIRASPTPLSPQDVRSAVWALVSEGRIVLTPTRQLKVARAGSGGRAKKQPAAAR